MVDDRLQDSPHRYGLVNIHCIVIPVTRVDASLQRRIRQQRQECKTKGENDPPALSSLVAASHRFQLLDRPAHFFCLESPSTAGVERGYSMIQKSSSGPPRQKSLDRPPSYNSLKRSRSSLRVPPSEKDQTTKAGAEEAPGIERTLGCTSLRPLTCCCASRAFLPLVSFP